MTHHKNREMLDEALKNQPKGEGEKLLGELMSKVQGIKEITDDMVVVVTKVKDWDEHNNDFFAKEELKSYPHEGLVCHGCKEEVVISNFAWNEGRVVREKVMCLPCVLGIIETEHSKPLAKDVWWKRVWNKIFRSH